MKSLLKRVLSGAAIFGLGAALVPLMAAPASAAPGAQPPPTLTPNPVATQTAPFSFSVGGGAFCDGTGAQGWRVHSFIVNAGVDLSTLDFTGATSGVPGYVGLDFDGSDGTISAPLHKGTEAGINYTPAGSPAGQINASDLAGFNFDPATGWAFQDGVYQVGFACVNGPGAIQQWWSNTVTIDADAAPNPFLVDGVAPDAPTLTTVVPDSGECAVSFTPGSPEPGDSFRAEADDGTTVTSETGAGSPLTISGLTNGTSYDVTVYAITAAGETVSTNTLSCVPETNGGAVLALVVTDSGTDDAGSGPYVDVDWDAPAAVGGCTVDSYNVGVTPSGTPVQPDPSPTGTGTGGSARVTGVPTNVSITVTVTPTFAAGCVGTPANVPAFVATGNVVIQDIDVTRPIGALVLTQVCGTNGAIPADGTSPAIVANNSSTVGGPNLPSPSGNPSLVVDPAGGGIMDQDPADQDPAYAAYPYPTDGNGVANPASETHCGLDLGVAEFVTQGPGSGQYFAAEAALNQITIVDTRNVDLGWTVTGEMESFVATSEADDGTGTGALDSFSGDFLGWTPVLTEDTSGFDDDADAGTPDYDQQVAAGTPVAPNTIGGLGDGATLAVAGPDEGLGTAILDARVRLLIPVTADAGQYEGSLRFSAL
ncbi:MAG: hypothetical protein ACSLFP_06945 [Acidimicrobiales bacterium]